MRALILDAHGEADLSVRVHGGGPLSGDARMWIPIRPQRQDLPSVTLWEWKSGRI